MADPVLDILNSHAEGATSASGGDAVLDILNDHASGKKFTVVDTKKKPQFTAPTEEMGSLGEGARSVGRAAVGVMENAIPAVQSLYAEPAAWLAKQGTMYANAAGLTDRTPEQVQGSVRDFLTMHPQTEAGKAVQGGIGAVMAPVVDSAKFYGDLVNRVPGVGPAAVNAAEGFLAMAPATEMLRGFSVPAQAAANAKRIGADAKALPEVPRETPAPAAVAPETPKGPFSAPPEPIGKTESGTPIPGAPSTLTATGNPRAAFWEPPAAGKVTVDSEPVTGGVPKEFSTDRAQILDRVGLEHARESSLTGDAKAAATDFQMSRFDEPAGKAAFDQFATEKQALNKFSTGIVEKTRGSLGLDEDALNTRGQSMAAPFDALREWFKDQRKDLYDKADERSGGHAVVQPLSIDELLNDRSFNNQLTARGQTHMVTGIKSELERFKEANGGTLTVKEAEQFRQFLNTIWTPDNSAIVGKLKGALDDDVLKGAGEDLYGPARAMAQMEKQTLDNPNGISKLFDVDPQNPINRTTSLDKIPDTLNRMSPEQFTNVIKTLQAMPEALQPQAQAALAEVKAHLANKALEAGSKTQGQWNAAGVSEVLKKNSAKLKVAFEDQPEVLAMLQDLDSAGRILKVDGSYPGAAAQAANAMKRGFMSHAISKAASGTGALIGSMMGPVGSMAGAVGGEFLGGKMGSSMAEAKALGNWEKGSVRLKDLLIKDKK